MRTCSPHRPAKTTLHLSSSPPLPFLPRRWYERHKHVFPASRWEVYDPAVVRERYTTHGEEVHVVQSKHGDAGPLKGYAPK